MLLVSWRKTCPGFDRHRQRCTQATNLGVRWVRLDARIRPIDGGEIMKLGRALSLLLVLAAAGCSSNSGGTTTPTACGYSLAAATQAAPAGGGSFAVTVTKASGSCTWTASSDASWITFNGASTGTDTGTLTYVAAAEPGHRVQNRNHHRPVDGRQCATGGDSGRYAGAGTHSLRLRRDSCHASRPCRGRNVCRDCHHIGSRVLLDRVG